MKQSRKSILGVTLLEIMLVLAIAAMVIVMSIRYYQTATSGEQANSTLEQLQAVQVAADELAQAGGSYSAIGSSGANLLPLLPKNGITLPWGLSMSITASSNSYTIGIPAVPTGTCPLFASRLGANAHYAVSGSCGTSAVSLVIVYTANI